MLGMLRYVKHMTLNHKKIAKEQLKKSSYNEQVDDI